MIDLKKKEDKKKVVSRSMHDDPFRILFKVLPMVASLTLIVAMFAFAGELIPAAANRIVVFIDGEDNDDDDYNQLQEGVILEKLYRGGSYKLLINNDEIEIDDDLWLSLEEGQRVLYRPSTFAYSSEIRILNDDEDKDDDDSFERVEFDD